MRAHFRGDRPLCGRDLKGGHNAPLMPPGRTKTSNSPAFLGLKKIIIIFITVDRPQLDRFMSTSKIIIM